MKALEYFTRHRSVLCIVAETEGSCPGKAGFKMAVPPDGVPVGSVGGGSLEGTVIEIAGEILGGRSRLSILRTFNHTAAAEPHEKSGMICSGRQTILLVPFPALNTRGKAARGISVTPSGLEFLGEPPDLQGLATDGKTWRYTETIEMPPVVYIFGGGHCSLALTGVLHSLDMKTVIIDDREHVWTMERNSLAWHKILMDYSRAGPLVPDSGRALVVIMTASHRGDATVLEQMLQKNLRYLGMMASRATAKYIMNQMLAKGFTPEQLEAVHTPIGLPINSRTPAEIAVSIAAEIIEVINR